MESVSSQEQQSTGYKRRSSGRRRRGTTGSSSTATAVATKSAAEETSTSDAAAVAAQESRSEAKARAIAEKEAAGGQPSLVGRIVNTDRFEGIRRFIRETWAEIQKVIWPDRETTRNLTLLVIALSLVLGLLLGGIDFILFELFEALP